VFRLDSKLVVKQVNRDWKIKNERMQKYVNQARQLIQQIPYPVEVIYVDRAKNETADWLANQAIDLAQQ
jgi:ribonuclease HI